MRTKGFIKYLSVKGNESFSYSGYLYQGLEYQQLDFSVKTKSQIVVCVRWSYRLGGWMKNGGPGNPWRPNKADGDDVCTGDCRAQAFTDAQVIKFCKGIKRKGAEAEFPECCFPPNNPFSQNSVPCVMTGISLLSYWSGTVD